MKEMKLSNLVKSKGFKDKAPRIGRGNASKGNTSGKGNKGQKARSGGSISPFFEGGQTPLIQKLPKFKGFKRYFKLVDHYAVVNLQNLESDVKITDGMELSKFKLKELGYIKKESELVKILGTGELKKKLVFVGMDKFSKTAQTKIEKAGGEIK